MSAQTANPVASTLDKLQDAHIIPDVIPTSVNFQPSVFFTVHYSSTNVEVNLGQMLSKEVTQEEPEIRIEEGGGTDKSYTMVMTDPDAPSREDPKFGQWRHWVVSGLKVPSSINVLEKSKLASTPYQGPAPPPGTGSHRYVFLLFEEPTGFTIPRTAVESDGDSKTRGKWNAMRFSGQHGLRLVGVNHLLVEDPK